MNGLRKKIVAALAAVCFLWPVSANAQGWLDAFDPMQVLTLNLDIAPDDWDTVRYDLSYDIEVPAQFWADGEAPILVSVRRKSSDGLPSESDPKKVGLKIDINEYVSGQKWRSLTKLSLESSTASNVVKEGLAWNLHRMASGVLGYGYDAALAAWVRVMVNGEYVGVYTNVEQRNKQFLRNRGLYSAETKYGTWLYKMSDLDSPTLKVGTGDSPTSIELCYAPFKGATTGKGKGKKSSSACSTPDDALLYTELNELIDMQGMLTMAAVNAYLADGDILFSKAKNFYYADFLNAGPRLYLPWDLDAGLGGNGTTYPIYAMPSNSKKRGRKTQTATTYEQTAYQEIILNHRLFRAQYNQILLDLMDGPMSVASVHAFLYELEVVLTPALEEDPYIDLGGSVSGHFNSLRQWIVDRDANVRAQIAANGPPYAR